MGAPVCLNYDKRPSAIIALAKAFWGISRRYDAKTDTADICAIWHNTGIEPGHLNEFNDICGLHHNRDKVNMVYPLSLIFPLVIRVLGHSKAPLTIFRSLNTKTRIISHQEIRTDEAMTISCRMTERRFVHNGLELNLASTIESQGRILWECVQTFLYRGRFGQADQAERQNEMAVIDDAPLIDEWFLPEGLGFKFAKISGDSNGIHYNASYAKLFGFERDFAQPMLVLPKALELISGKANGNRLDICFKGPVYYQRRVQVRGASIDEGFRFNISCEGNPKPCICGLLANQTDC